MPRPEERKKCAVCNHVLNYTEEYVNGELQGGNWTHAQQDLNDHPTVAVPLDEGGAVTVMCDFCGSLDAEAAWLECVPFAVANPKTSETVMDDGKWSMCRECLLTWDPETIVPMIDRSAAMHQKAHNMTNEETEFNRAFILTPIYQHVFDNFVAFHPPGEEP